MKFDLHSNLAEQITIENLKWHYDAIQADLSKEGYLTHEEDILYYGSLLNCLNAVLRYFCGDREAEPLDPLVAVWENQND